MTAAREISHHVEGLALPRALIGQRGLHAADLDPVHADGELRVAHPGVLGDGERERVGTAAKRDRREFACCARRLTIRRRTFIRRWIWFYFHDQRVICNI